MEKRLRDLLPELWQNPETAVDNNNLPIRLEHLCGDGEWVSALQQAQEIPLAVLEHIKGAALKAFFSIQPDGSFQPYSNIKQLPSEPFATFVEQLTRAIELQVKNEGAQEQVLEEMALTNVNKQCKAAILSLPLEPMPTLDDMLYMSTQKVPLMTAHQSHSSRDAFRPLQRAAAAGAMPPVPVPRPPPKRRTTCLLYDQEKSPDMTLSDHDVSRPCLTTECLQRPFRLQLTESLHLSDTDWHLGSLDLQVPGSWQHVGRFELQEEKIQRMPPWKYLGLEIDASGTSHKSVITWKNPQTQQWEKDIAEVEGSPQVAELAAVVRAFEKFPEPFNLVTDLAYVAGVVSRAEQAVLSEVSNAALFNLLSKLVNLISHREQQFYVMHIRSLIDLPGFIAEGNRRADALAAPVEMAPLPNIFGQAKISHQLFHQNVPGLVWSST
ncbi:hypothetical protein DUI87_05002 [Hirundo rustica rustica]|uniref:RNase H type-1 domain-containing protein n=1 Tax=Hirundo rustica rustica TaxID=333673 RepID=A0A3M0KXW1_HIRRU|nr:hypothetical protein DUI87_05002 [Hirundo rustica rustica]